jgi:hypothetical protein
MAALRIPPRQQCNNTFLSVLFVSDVSTLSMYLVKSAPKYFNPILIAS